MPATIGKGSGQGSPLPEGTSGTLAAVRGFNGAFLPPLPRWPQRWLDSLPVTHGF